ncbi:putative Ig domain-containing protein [Stieleria sp. ICT_E10.1]|uniref:putative Ig domain-containing protein n=1 Tax=Stieleria sedimenti TaxID=2976331 RepID=UPI00217F729D|nr:putative Ig domain-containing protein [Stieleria sedimenti]MCS7466146.1 putative Ig domain-containing protein [Stieleria sedimenti]
MSRFAPKSRAKKARHRRKTRHHRMEQLEQRLLLASDWQNPSRPLDVNNDGQASPLDALRVINKLASTGENRLGPRTNSLASYFDTNADGAVSPLDALRVINGIGHAGTGPVYTIAEGEGDSAPAGFTSIMFMTLPGNETELVDVNTQFEFIAEQFNELGYFVVETATGEVGGRHPTDPGYAEKVFESANRHVVYSKFRSAPSAWETTLPAGSHLGVYVLQPADDQGNPENHLRVRGANSNVLAADDQHHSTHQIGWEMHARNWPSHLVGDRSFDDVLIDVTIGKPYPSNLPPQLDSIPRQTVDEEQPFTYDVAASDPNPNDTLAYTLLDAPTGMSISGQTGKIQWTPSEAFGPGQYDVTVHVEDLAGERDQTSFAIDVREVNKPPVLARVENQQVEEQTELKLQLSATDPDLPANTLTYSIESGLSGASLDPVTGEFTWTPTEEQGPGDYVIAVRVSDGDKFDEESFTVVVSEDNEMPILSPIGDFVVRVGEPVQFTAQATDPDIPENRLTYRLAAGAPAGASIDAETGQFSWTPTGQQSRQDYNLSVIVSDNVDPVALTDMQSFVVSVVNSAPEMDAIEGQIVDELTEWTLSTSATEIDLPSDSLAYSLQSSPAGMQIDSQTGELSWTPTELQGPGSFAVVVVVTDLDGATNTESFTIVAREVNVAPDAETIVDQTIDELVPFSLQVTATDVDHPANLLGYTLTQGPAGAQIDPVSGEFSWTPSEADGPGTYPIIVTVTDSGTPNLSDHVSFEITVKEVNRQPVLDFIPDQTVDEETTLTFTATASDPDIPANNLTFSVTGNPPTSSIDPVSGVFTWTPSETDAPMNYVIQVKVSDNQNPELTDSQEVVISALEVNEPPVLETIDDVTVELGQTVAFTAIATDPDSPLNTLTYSLDAGAPDGASIDPETGAFTWTPTADQDGEVYPITVRVTDDGDPIMDDSDTFQVSVGSCAFSNLDNWTVNEYGGTNNPGSVIVDSCSAVMTEGDSLLVTLERGFVVPEAETVLRVSYADLSFDESDENFINDAFEIAVLDEFGNSLVQTISPDRDSIVNATESLSRLVADAAETVDSAGVTTVTIGLEAIPDGTHAYLSLRLVGDDRDELTSVRVLRMELVGSSQDFDSPAILSLMQEASRRIESSRPSGAIVEPIVFSLTSPNLPSSAVSVRSSTPEIDLTVQSPGTDFPAGTSVLLSGKVTTPGYQDVEHSIGFELIPGAMSEGTPIADQFLESHRVSFLLQSGESPILGQYGAPSSGFDGFNGLADEPSDASGLGDFFLTDDGLVDGTTDSLVLEFQNPTSAVSGTLLDIDSDPSSFTVFESDGTPGYYNASIGSRLNGTSFLFPTSSDPTINNAPEPDLSPVADILGDWLTNGPAALNDNWSFRSIPTSWPVNTETAIIYEIDGGPGGIQDLRGNFGVDNGIFVWLNGEYKFGALGAGGVGRYEYANIDLGDLRPGKNYLQVLREDHGSVNGFAIRVTGNLVPADAWRVSAFDSAGEEITSVEVNSATATIGNGAASSFSLADENARIRSLKIDYVGNRTERIGFGLDNLRFTSRRAGSSVSHVTVNGDSVDVLDPSGNLFHLVDVGPGRNSYQVIAYDEFQNSVSASLEITGSSSAGFDLSRFSDITGSFGAVYGHTSFNEDSDQLLINLATTNTGTFETDVPLLVGIKNISDPTVSVVGADGVMPDGTPYYDYTEAVGDGTLEAGETTASPTVTFHTPSRQQFDYELVFYGKLNEAPIIESLPKIEAAYDREYRYEVLATDPDDDPLSYTLSTKPVGMDFAQGTTEIVWQPTASDIGYHDIVVTVTDDRGGTAEQRFTIEVLEGPPNRPPIITSTPVTTATIAEKVSLESKPLDPNLKTQVDYLRTPSDGKAIWDVRPDGSVFQTENSDPSFFLFDEEIPLNSRIEGTFQVTPVVDDDGIGFVFGFRDRDTFYTFHWSNSGFNQNAQPGMRIRKFDGSFTVNGHNFDNDLFNGPQTLYQNTLTWQGIPYNFVIEQAEDQFRIVIKDGANVIIDETIYDPDFAGGRFGFMNYSVENVFYSGHVFTPKTAPSYRYDVDAIDPDFDPIQYTLLDGPDGMQINPASGLITWAPSEDDLRDESLPTQNPSLPVAPGFAVSIHADINEPNELAFDSLGNLYVGNGGNPGSETSPEKIRRIAKGGDLATEYGEAPISDPDAVAFDRTGLISGVPGSVLVGGLPGSITAVHPDGTVAMVFGPSDSINNVDSMTFDNAGRLLFLAHGTSNIMVSTGDEPSVLASVPGPTFAIAVDPLNRFVISNEDGSLRLYDSDGTLLDGQYAVNLGFAPPIAFGPGGVWGTDLYLVNNDTDQLLRMGSDGAMTVIGSGFTDRVSDLRFGPDGALYLSQGVADRILRITPQQSTRGLAGNEHSVLVAAIDGRGGVANQEFTICVHPDPENKPPTIISTPINASVVSPSFDFDDFTNTNGLTLNGRATTVDQRLRLVRGEFGTEGSAFSSERVSVRNGFVSEFEFRVDPGPDGFAFVIQNDSASSSGGTGGNLGYGQIANSLAIEFDTFNNGSGFGIFDPSDNHISVISAGREPNNSSHTYALANVTPPFNIDDGQIHQARIEYVPGNLKLFVEGSISPLIDLDVDLENILGTSLVDDRGRAFVGFSAGNGTRFSIHEIVSWTFTPNENVYEYDVDAIDPDEDTLTYGLVDGPTGMTIDPETGFVEWNVSVPDLITVTIGDEDFFGFGTGSIGEPTPAIDFDNRDTDDPPYTDRDLRTSVSGDDVLNDISWENDLSFIQSRAQSVTVELAIGGIQDGNEALIEFDDRLFIEDLEVNAAFDAIDDGPFGTRLISFALTAAQLDSFNLDGLLNFDFLGGRVSDQSPVSAGRLESYFIDYLRVFFAPEPIHQVTVSVTDGRGGYDEQRFDIEIRDVGSGEIRGTKFIEGITVAESTFDDGPAGWTLSENQEANFSWHDSGGNEGGHIRFTDILNPGSQFIASASFLGDWSELDNRGVLTYEQRVFAVGGSVINTHPYSVSISGPGGSANWTGDTPTGVTPWIQQIVPIQESEWTITSGTWSEILADVDRLAIAGELFGNNTNPPDVSGVDNVRLINNPSPAGWTIYLDQNQNGIRDIGERFEVTDENGNYAFSGLPGGTYYVREEIPPGWAQTFPGQNPPPEFWVASGERTPGQLLKVQANAVADEILYSESSNIYEALERLPDGQFLAVTGDPADLSLERFLVQIDPFSGDVVDLGSVTGVSHIEGLAFVGETLYAAVSTNFDHAAERLAIIDMETMTSHPIGIFGDGYTNVEGLAASPSGKLFATDVETNSLFTININTGEAVTRVGDANRMFALDFDSDGRLYGVPFDTAGVSQLVELDPVTGAIISSEPIDANYGNGLIVERNRTPLGYTVTLPKNRTISGMEFVNRQIDSANNRPPTFDSTPFESVAFFDLYRYDVDASDPENDTLTYSLLTAPDGMTVHPTLGTVVWVPKEDQQGDHNVLLAVSDGNGGTDLQPFTITVTTPNTAPVITSLPPEATLAGAIYSYPIRVQDPDLASDGDELSYRLADGHPVGMTLELVSIKNSTGQQVDVYYAVSWGVPADDAGTSADVTLIVSDEQGAEDRQSWSIAVNDPASGNVDPEIRSKPRRKARFGIEWVYPIDAFDANGDSLAYSLDGSPANMTVTEKGFVSWTPPADAPKSVSFDVIVTDGRGGEARQPISLSVASIDANGRPIITSVPGVASVINLPYSYDPVANDPDGDSLRWELTAAPRGMSIDGRTGKIRWTPDDQQIGTHIVAVTASDPFLASYTQRYSIHVGCNNLAPAIVSIPPTVGLTDRTYLYPVRADDFEDDKLTWSLTTAPDNMSIDRDSGLIRWTPTNTQLGSHNVVIEVSDDINTGTQRYTVVVSNSNDPVDPGNPDGPKKGNRAPIFRSTPVYGAEVDALYQYQVSAIDPDGDTVTYGLGTNVPAGMEINDGLITWTPTINDVGAPLITVTATDEHGAVSTQGYVLSVAENEPPEITSTHVISVTRGATYRYTVGANDPEGGPLAWSLDDNTPQGMTIDTRGRILWDTSSFTGDSAFVTVTVTDDRGQTDSDTWTINVSDDTTPPSVSILVKSSSFSFFGDGQLDVRSAYTVEVYATDNVGVTEVELFVDGTRVALDQNFTAELVATSIPTTVSLEAVARDAAGLDGRSISALTIVDPAVTNQPTIGGQGVPPHPGTTDPTDTGSPIVEITKPKLGDSITNAVPIIGTVRDPEDNLWYYQAIYARADRVSITSIDLDDPDWVVFHQSTEPVVNGEIAVFDPSALTNDAYAIAVVAYDINASGWVEPIMVFVDGNVQVGNFRIELTDLSLPLNGIPIEVTRVYDTDNAPDEGDFGYGWNLGVQDPRILETVALSAGGAFNGGNDKLVPGRSKIYLTNPSGQRVGFTYEERLVSASFFGGIYRAEFVPDSGVYDTLTIDNPTVARGGIIGALGQGINPNVYTLTTNAGIKYRYNQFSGLQTITDLNGNVVTFTENGISHSSGQSIDFVRDHRGRIKEVVDPSGNKIVYQYDAAGDLRSVTDLAGLTTSYTYRDEPEHFLDQAFDPQGDAVLTAVYEKHPDYRIYEFKSVVDAAGNRIDDRDFETSANFGVVRDANGNPTELLFDNRGNVLEEKDPLGNVTFREYGDLKNPDLETRIIDRRGFVTEREYDARGNVRKIVELGTESDPFDEPIVTEFTYDRGNRVKSIKNALGATTVFNYDSRGNLTKITNAEGNSSTFTYDGEGRRQTFTDFNGNTTTFDYTNACPCGSPSTVTHPDGTYQTFDYNQFGQVTREASYEADGTLVEQRETKYDSAGRVMEEKTGVDGDANHPPTIVRRFYDEHLLDWEIIISPQSLDGSGNLTESPATPVDDRFSRITDFEYDQNDRLIRQIDAEAWWNPTTNRFEGKNGDPRGVVEFRYDAQGNRVLLQDPVGNITTWVYDELNRVVEERDPFYWVDIVEADASLQGISNDELLDRIAPIVPVSPANPSDPRDPLYDDPSGASCETNTAADHIRLTCYDAEGNQVKTIDRNARSREFEYDHAGRLEEERWNNAPDHATDPNALVETVNFTYDTLGNMLTASDSNSRYLHTYDVLNRLTSVDNNPLDDRDVPRVILNYEYDPQGNVTKTYDDAGVTVESEYDSRNRLWIRKWYDADVPTGEDPDVDPARVDFFYNAAGREKEVRRYADLDANTLVGRTERTYDTVGRSDDLIHRNSVDELLAGYDYDYDFSGLLTTEDRTHQDQQYAQSITYAYDLTGQLTSADFDTQADEIYVYDLNGNRLTSAVGNDQRTYITGPANQLQSDGIYRYEYDGEGNQIKRVPILPDGSDDPSGTVRTFIYDHRNRLVRVDDWSTDPGDPRNPAAGAILTQSVEYTYDALGRRLARTADFDGEGQEVAESEYIVFDRDHTWADLDTAELAVNRYLQGNRIDHNLARMRQGIEIDWYLADRIGSTRDQVSQFTPLRHIAYEAFGKINTSLDPEFFDRFTFTGRELDMNTGDYYFRARVLNASTGSFITADQFGFRSLDTNLYRYVGNSPLNATDPSGNISLAAKAALVGAIAVGALSFSASLVVNSTCKQTDSFGEMVVRSASYTVKGATVGAVAGFAFFKAGLALRGLSGMVGRTGFVFGDVTTRTAAISTIEGVSASQGQIVVGGIAALTALLERDVAECLAVVIDS